MTSANVLQKKIRQKIVINFYLLTIDSWDNDDDDDEEPLVAKKHLTIISRTALFSGCSSLSTPEPATICFSFARNRGDNAEELADIDGSNRRFVRSFTSQRKSCD